MIPTLLIYRRKVARRQSQKGKILFAVVDSSQPGEYPTNFLCILPFSPGETCKRSSFGKLFGNEAFGVAQKLLSEASQHQTDPAILKEIQRRKKEYEQVIMPITFIIVCLSKLNSSGHRENLGVELTLSLVGVFLQPQSDKYFFLNQCTRARF